jgi:hypothetical protein
LSSVVRKAFAKLDKGDRVNSPRDWSSNSAEGGWAVKLGLGRDVVILRIWIVVLLDSLFIHGLGNRLATTLVGVNIVQTSSLHDFGIVDRHDCGHSITEFKVSMVRTIA